MGISDNQIIKTMERAGYTVMRTLGPNDEVLMWGKSTHATLAVIAHPGLYGYKYARHQNESRLAEINRKLNLNLTANDVIFIYAGDSAALRITGTNTVSINVNTGRARIRLNSSENAVRQELAKMLQTADARSFIGHVYYGESYGCGHKPVVTIALAALVCIVSLCVMNTESAPMMALNAEYFTTRPSMLVTYMFAHASALHLLSNEIFLILFGIAYERKRGALAMFTLFMTGGVFAGTMSIAWTSFKETATTTIGMSGAVFAVLGAYIIESVCEGSPEQKRSAIKYCIVTFLVSSIGRNVDTMCHLGGMVAGLIIGVTVWLLSKEIESRKLVRVAKLAR